MELKPLVSVLVNNYNYGKYIKFCIDSVLNQTYENTEIIVYDDGSTDNSLQILNEYKNKIKVISNKNFGQYPSFNQANAINESFKVSKGEIICLLDSDDGFVKDKIEIIVSAFLSNPDLSLVQNLSYKIDENDTIKKEKTFIKNISNQKEYIYKTHNLLDLFAQTSSLSFKRTYLEQVLPIYPDQFKLVWPDVRLSRFSIFYGKTHTIFQPLTLYRIHELNDSHKLKDKDFYKQVIIQMYTLFNIYTKEKDGIEIDYKKSIINPYENFLSKTKSLIFSNEKIKYKIYYILNALIKTLNKK